MGPRKTFAGGGFPASRLYLGSARMKEKLTSSGKVKMPKIQSASFGDEEMREDRRGGHDEHAVSPSAAAATRPPSSRPDIVPMLNLETTPSMRGLDKYKKQKKKKKKDHVLLGSQTERGQPGGATWR